MRVIALHGDFASGSMLRRDAGIEHWEYPDWKRDGNVPIPREPYALVGYSRGGSQIGHLSISTVLEPDCAVLYESPLIGRDTVGGSFPVLWIENDRGARTRNRRRAREMQSTLDAWRANGRRVDVMKGSGRHVERTWGWPPLRHGWDRSLNTMILEWIDEQA